MNATVAYAVIPIVNTTYETTATRTPWSVSRPILCQADLDEANKTLQMMKSTRDTPGISMVMWHYMSLRIEKVKALIKEREENSI